MYRRGPSLSILKGVVQQDPSVRVHTKHKNKCPDICVIYGLILTRKVTILDYELQCTLIILLVCVTIQLWYQGRDTYLDTPLEAWKGQDV
jgi:hypothetical protein